MKTSFDKKYYNKILKVESSCTGGGEGIASLFRDVECFLHRTKNDEEHFKVQSDFGMSGCRWAETSSVLA